MPALRGIDVVLLIDLVAQQFHYTSGIRREESSECRNGTPPDYELPGRSS